MNEASILVKLEHENLAKLLGYCIEGTSLLLVYEFQLYTSFDSLLFIHEFSLIIIIIIFLRKFKIIFTFRNMTLQN